MKKVLSVALASAMVLGMGANAFAITYNTSTNDEADWPSKFQFDGELFVTDKDDKIITDATTALNDNEAVDFEPGDVIWMPLYADDQVDYTADYTVGEDEVEAIRSIKLDKSAYTLAEGEKEKAYLGSNGKWYTDENCNVSFHNNAAGWSTVDGQPVTTEGWYTLYNNGATKASVKVPTTVKVTVDGKEETRNVESVKITIDGKTFSGSPEKVQEQINDYLDEKETSGSANAYYAHGYSISGTVNTEHVDATDDVVEKPEVNTSAGVEVDYGHYTGNIDKNWSINLVEKSTGVAELIEKAELYKATATDYASYSRFNNNAIDIMPNAVYLKITLKDEWKTVDSETLTYYVYIADNDSGEQTNEVWVSGTYVNNDWEYVDFDWTNDASVAKLWKVKKGENGTAVFDFADKAFFTVKMYSGESMYLDLSTAYDKAVAGEMDAEADSFYKFDNDNANFSRTGELIIVTDDETLVPYEIDEDGNFVEVDAKYVEDYAIAHTNKKVDGFVFNTKTLGNYVLSTEELGQEEQPAKETPAEPVTPSEPTTETPSTSKPNPETGAEDFVGLAVSLAVVSVAAAGALALKK